MSKETNYEKFDYPMNKNGSKINKKQKQRDTFSDLPPLKLDVHLLFKTVFPCRLIVTSTVTHPSLASSKDFTHLPEHTKL